MVEKGDLIKFSNGEIAIAVKGPYTHKLMEHQDYEMVACGMSNFAGVYTAAFDVVFPETGKLKRVICGRTQFTVLKSKETE